MFEFNTKTGLITENGVKPPFDNQCYSGHGDGRNNPDMENIPSVGPTPRGSYRFGQAYDDPGGLGRLVMHLDPLPGTDTFGRSLFRIHGDNVSHDASHGCIVVPHDLRVHISQAQDRVMKVWS